MIRTYDRVAKFDSETRHIVYDLALVKYINDLGLDVFMKSAVTLGEQFGTVGAIRTPAKVKIVLDMLQLNKFFVFADSLEEVRELMDKAKSSPQ
jgi:anti-anti-sigma regulatory factor